MRTVPHHRSCPNGPDDQGCWPCERGLGEECVVCDWEPGMGTAPNDQPAWQTAELARLLAMTYTPKGVTVWLAHAEKQGWTIDEQIARARVMAEGEFS